MSATEEHVVWFHERVEEATRKGADWRALADVSERATAKFLDAVKEEALWRIGAARMRRRAEGDGDDRKRHAALKAARIELEGIVSSNPSVGRCFLEKLAALDQRAGGASQPRPTPIFVVATEVLQSFHAQVHEQVAVLGGASSPRSARLRQGAPAWTLPRGEFLVASQGVSTKDWDLSALSACTQPARTRSSSPPERQALLQTALAVAFDSFVGKWGWNVGPVAAVGTAVLHRAFEQSEGASEIEKLGAREAVCVRILANNVGRGLRSWVSNVEGRKLFWTPRDPGGKRELKAALSKFEVKRKKLAEAHYFMWGSLFCFSLEGVQRLQKEPPYSRHLSACWHLCTAREAVLSQMEAVERILGTDDPSARAARDLRTVDTAAKWEVSELMADLRRRNMFCAVWADIRPEQCTFVATGAGGRALFAELDVDLEEGGGGEEGEGGGEEEEEGEEEDGEEEEEDEGDEEEDKENKEE